MKGPYTVILTGGNSGIGLHMARALIEDGHRVAILDLVGEQVLADAERSGGRLRFLACDVADPATVQQAIAAVHREWGRVDVLVNNACLCRFGAFVERPLSDWERELTVNLLGYVHTIAAVLPIMVAQGGGVIHNVGSGVGITGFAHIAPYAAAKGAIEALTRSLALELAPYGIVVNLMHPPLTRTPSSVHLGVPPQVMADPAEVGRRLARRVGSRNQVITPDWRTALGLWLFRHFPDGVGRLLHQLTARSRATGAVPRA